LKKLKKLMVKCYSHSCIGKVNYRYFITAGKNLPLPLYRR
jgi:hypothetical protein